MGFFFERAFLSTAEIFLVSPSPTKLFSENVVNYVYFLEFISL